jgi:hypothetical protein
MMQVTLSLSLSFFNRQAEEKKRQEEEQKR